MTWLNGYRMRLVLVGCVAAIVLGGGSAMADFTFGEPIYLGPPVNSVQGDFDPHISHDGLSLYFSSTRPGGRGPDDLYVTKRESVNDPWGSPANLGQTVNSSSYDLDPSLSMDELSLLFVSGRPGGSGNFDIWVTTRLTRDDPWDRPVNLGLVVNSASDDADPSLSKNGLELYFCSNQPGGHGLYDIWVASRETVNAVWEEPTNLGLPVNSPYSDHSPSISADGLTLFFCRGMSYLVADLWIARRNTEDDTWGAPMNLGPVVNILNSNLDPDVSADGLWLFWQSSDSPNNRASWDIYQAPIMPVVDLNGDGIVDSKDMCIMVDHWGEDYPLCDIGPTPLGDGIVDVEDLIVLAEHLFEEVNDPTFVAHWALDEIEGDIAYDSVGENHAEVMGSAVWQPTGGVVDGALLLDGVDDCMATEYVHDPSEGPLSVFAWVKGGAPGQVLVSQAVGANWLMTDSSSGNLMTELKESGRAGSALLSETVITDGNWHRVGLVWDGTNRILYVDDVAVAADTQSELVGSNGGLNIGCGKNLEPSSFWSGLIDDVRIYNRAVEP